MSLARIITYAAIAVGAYAIIKKMSPPPVEGADVSRTQTPLVGYNPATSAPSAFGAGVIWQSATRRSYNPYASPIAWAPSSNGYGWNGDFYPVPLR